jgi:hypothetical protein
LTKFSDVILFITNKLYSDYQKGGGQNNFQPKTHSPPSQLKFYNIQGDSRTPFIIETFWFPKIVLCNMKMKMATLPDISEIDTIFIFLNGKAPFWFQIWILR